MNLVRGASLLQALARAGVAETVLCPGGRNAPLAALLARARGGTLHTHYEERGAAWFALGCARRTGRPAAVVTTSGTAAAELLPAAMEAHHRGVPLVLVTADRPVRLRGTGAPQAVVQPGLFGAYAPTLFDGMGGEERALAGWDGRGPVHLNPCFDEPLLEGEVPVLDLAPQAPGAKGAGAVETGGSGVDRAPLAAFLERVGRPLVVVGELAPSERPGVIDFLGRYGAPVFAEALSGLRGESALEGLLLRSGGKGLETLPWDGILRLGGVPLARLWRELDRPGEVRPVFSVDRVPLAGLAEGGILAGVPGEVLAGLDDFAVDRDYVREVLAADRRRQPRVENLVADAPRSEPALLGALARKLPPGSLVYLGNSNPIRDWELATAGWSPPVESAANRGVNGIDGQLSTFLGLAAPGRENWAVLGDLTALYDLGAPWVLRAPAVPVVRIVVVNNGGGQIFRGLFSDPLFRNEHSLDFAGWAAMWGLGHRVWERIPATFDLPDRAVIELRPDGAETDRLRQALRELEW